MLNILTFPTHERYESNLAKTGHNFYSFHLKGGKKWNSDQTERPENYYILPEGDTGSYIDYDLILVQSKFWQFQVASQINQHLHLPMIVLEHTLPTPQTINPQQLHGMRQMLGDVNVFISEFSQKAWEINHNAVIIHHGVDTEVFSGKSTVRTPHVLTVANEFANRDYCLNFSGWKRVTKDLPVRLVGNNPGLSESAKSIEDLRSEYNSSLIYFNSTTISPIPTTLLEAMACGCAVVSTATCMIPEVIQHGVNGLISNDENELRGFIQHLLANPEMARKLGENARKTVQQNFSLDNFINNWNNLFRQVLEVFK